MAVNLVHVERCFSQSFVFVVRMICQRSPGTENNKDEFKGSILPKTDSSIELHRSRENSIFWLLCSPFHELNSIWIIEFQLFRRLLGIIFNILNVSADEKSSCDKKSTVAPSKLCPDIGKSNFDRFNLLITKIH